MAEKKKDKKLTDKQKMFVKEYLVDKNGTQAMIRAGFSKKTAAETAYEYLRKPHIKNAIQKGLDKLAERAEFTAQDVLETIKDIIIANKYEHPNVALKGCELYGKHLKLFTDKLELSGDKENPLYIQDLSNLTDEELERLESIASKIEDTEA